MRARRLEDSIVAMKFNLLLDNLGIGPEKVILLRHQDKRSARGQTPYELWRDSDNRASFELYQSLQKIRDRSKFSRAPYWASFVATPDASTMFVGLYAAKYQGLLAEDTPKPHNDEIDRAGSRDVYDLLIDERLAGLYGKLFIEWGQGTRAWVQRADNQDKAIIELRREFKEPDFPGFLNFRKPLSKIEGLPKIWIAFLKQTAGVYLLTCPKTKEQYVGSASGEEGFWQRWVQYAVTGHGGNISLKSREPSDYQVSILEVAGSGSNSDDILKMESRWKEKLQSREMGLNKN